MQELYEKKLVTYPRTDARVLSTAVAKEISKNLNGLSKYGSVAVYLKEIAAMGTYKNLVKTVMSMINRLPIIMRSFRLDRDFRHFRWSPRRQGMCMTVL